MNTLVIKNKGLIEIEDLTLLGSSTKKGATNKIGMFGSGWKYALAWLMRNNIDIRIFSGKEEIEVGFIIKKHRDKEVAVITINGKETSITTEFGIEDWTGWMALREILSNAIDEGNHTINTYFNYDEDTIAETEVTTIVIPMVKELSDVMRAYDNYFAYEREADYMDNAGNLYYLKTTKSTMVVYRKGIRCVDMDVISDFDVNFLNISINESRLTTNSTVSGTMRANMKNGVLPFEIFIKCVQLGDNIFNSPNCNYNILAYLKKALDEGYKITTGYMIQAELMSGNILENNVDVSNKTLVVPGKWYNDLRKQGLVKGLEGKVDNEYVPEDARTCKANIDSNIKNLLKCYNLEFLTLVPCTWKDGSNCYVYENEVFYKMPLHELTEIEANTLAFNIVQQVPYALSSRTYKSMLIKYTQPSKED